MPHLKRCQMLHDLVNALLVCRGAENPGHVVISPVDVHVHPNCCNHGRARVGLQGCPYSQRELPFDCIGTQVQDTPGKNPSLRRPEHPSTADSAARGKDGEGLTYLPPGD